MNSSAVLVSLCVIRIEICDPESEETNSEHTMAARKMRGCRESRNISVATYTNVTENTTPLLSSQSTSKSHLSSRSNSEETSFGNSNHTVGSGEISELGAASSTSPDQISFISGNPFVEVTKGILHLFKEDELTEMHCAADRSHTICILSVPATMTCHDLLTFTAACHQNIQHFRILKDGSPNQYMALITFRSSSAASEFYETFNGAPYNSLEPEVVCHLVFVSRVEVGDNGMPLSGHTELPSCPVCLERMDESVDGILTILCNHTFHSSCLVKWGDTSCPICRYAQTPEPLADSRCMECVSDASTDALWICLICGHVGCSRYHQGHAFEHYRDTHHCYAMQLGNNRVWDYVGDNFVHRLLQDKDGKMVEGGHSAAKSEGAAVEEKVDSVQLEFTYLLTSQLETQRQYFEERLSRSEQRSMADINELRDKLGEVFEENSQFKKQFATLNRDKQTLEKRLQHSTNKCNLKRCEREFCQTITEHVDRSPLNGIRVLDLTRIVAGPYCTMILGDLGAEILKIERAGGGDEARKWGPPFFKGTQESTYFMSVNRNKKSVCVDLKRGKDIIYDLAQTCDVLVENYVPGKLNSIGLGYEDIAKVAPRLIYCSLTGYGSQGPYANRPGYDVIAASLGGLLHITGPKDGPPCKVGVAMTDLAMGLYAHGAIMAALLQRSKINKGQWIQCNLLSTQVASLINIASNYLNGDKEATRWGSEHESIVPYEAFPTKDGYMTVGAGSDLQFLELIKRLQLPELINNNKFKNNTARVKNRTELLQILRDVFKRKKNQEWSAIFEGASFPYGAVNTIKEVFDDPHVKYTKLVQELQHPVTGKVKLVGPPVTYSYASNTVRSSPPMLGQHTSEVLRNILKYSDEKIENLIAQEIVQ